SFQWTSGVNVTLNDLTVDVNTIVKYDVSGKYVVSELNLITNKETITDKDKSATLGVRTISGITYDVDIGAGVLVLTSKAKQTLSAVDDYITVPGGARFKYLNQTKAVAVKNITMHEYAETTETFYALNDTSGNNNVTVPNIPGAGTWYNCTSNFDCTITTAITTPAMVGGVSTAHYLKFVDNAGASLLLNVTQGGGAVAGTNHNLTVWYKATSAAPSYSVLGVGQSVLLAGGMNVSNVGPFNTHGVGMGSAMLFYLTKLNADIDGSAVQLVMGTNGVWSGSDNLAGIQLPALYGASLDWTTGCTTTGLSSNLDKCTTFTLTEPDGNTIVVEAARNKTDNGATLLTLKSAGTTKAANKGAASDFTTTWGSIVKYSDVSTDGNVTTDGMPGNISIGVPRYFLGFGFGENVWSNEVTVAEGGEGEISGTTFWVQDVTGGGDTVNAFGVGVGVLDSEAPSAGWDKPLILVGGPVVNLVTKEAADAGVIPTADDMLTAADAADAAGWASIAIADNAVNSQTVLAVWGWNQMDTRWAARALASEILTPGTIEGFSGASVWLNTESAASVSDVTVRT
ncbi:MAG: S-layer protein, partial [Candidatus Nanoarchaeia archaeon]|nr:S-layer protein [Candidatus Nanoarchaeia archaeon]